MLKKREIQSTVKHEILERYLGNWGGIIVNGLRGHYAKLTSIGKEFRTKFVYVDCFASMGRYISETENEFSFGSPVIGIRALEDIRRYAREQIGFLPERNAILIEQDKQKFDGLLETLEIIGFGSLIRKTVDFESLRDGEIAVINGDWQDHLQSLLNFTSQPYTKAFYLLDPYGPSGIPLSVVGKVVSQKNNDVMINFPYQDLHKKTGSVAKGTPIHIGHLQRYDSLYGDDDWRKIAQEYYLTEQTDEEKENLEQSLTDRYKKTLLMVDSELAIKLICLKFPAIQRTMFYLFLTTHDPTGALALNQILDEAELRQYDLRELRRNSRGDVTQMSMFEVLSDPSRPIVERPTTKVIAQYIYSICATETILFRDVLRRLIDESYYHREIKSAMTQLKSDKRAEYDKLTNETSVTFR